MKSTFDIIKMLTKYNRIANLEMNSVIQHLSSDEWNKNLGGFHESIKALCSHVFISDILKLKSISIIRNFNFASAEIMKKTYSKEIPPFNSVDEYLKLRKELDSVFDVFSGEVTAEDLDKKIEVINFKGEIKELKIEDIFFHVLNHQTHTRAMISIYLELLRKPNDFSSLISTIDKL